MAEAKGTQDWPELFVGLYERLTGSNAEITYSFDGLEIEVPSSTGPASPRATWKFTGTMRISTKDLSK
jgi:hypothetical protein